MRWDISNKEEKKIQKQDENQFYTFFNQKGYNPKKLDIGRIISSPDYSLTKNQTNVFCEIKSKFGDQAYEKIYTESLRRINALPFGFEYTFQHLYRKMPSPTEFNNVLQQVERKLENLPVPLKFPVELSHGLWEYKKTFEGIGGGKELPIIEKTFITLTGKNTTGKMTCDDLSRGYHGYPGERDKKYFKKEIEKAKNQLRSQIENNEIVGVIFFDHIGFGWTDTDVMSLYGDLDFQYRQNPDTDIWHITSGKNKIIGVDKKIWLSYLGFWEYADGRTFLTIYRNGFATKKLPKDYFPEPECKTYIIGPLDENGNIITDIPLLK
jgi:hypothetical protein